MRYHFIQEQQPHFSLAALCRTLQVGRSGYYAWHRRLPSARQQANARLTEQIKTVHKDSDQTYGSPRVYHELKAQGLRCSENRIAPLMRLHQIRAKSKPRLVVTTDSRHDLPVADNLLDRQFTAEQPDTRWSGDFTYIWTARAGCI